MAQLLGGGGLACLLMSQLEMCWYGWYCPKVLHAVELEARRVESSGVTIVTTIYIAQPASAPIASSKRRCIVKVSGVSCKRYELMSESFDKYHHCLRGKIDGVEDVVLYLH